MTKTIEARYMQKARAEWRPPNAGGGTLGKSSAYLANSKERFEICPEGACDDCLPRHA
jgi:hypothetical protein